MGRKSFGPALPQRHYAGVIATMVIAVLSGGFGNQMFQYACARALAIRRNDKLYLNIATYLRPRAARHYILNVFNIHGEVIHDLAILKGLAVVHSVTQIDSRFHAGAFDVSASTLVLRGFWESEKYFADHKDTIKRDFEFSLPLPHRYEPLADRIISTQSVCVHIRRTDILAEEQKGFVGLEYYRAAISRIARSVSNPVFYIFSDDIAWCRNNLHFAWPHEFVSLDDAATASIDFMLMCKCKHFIIANSTFSWWGAWLAKNEHKIVVAPKRWFRNEGQWNAAMPHVFYSDDLIPYGWIQL